MGIFEGGNDSEEEVKINPGNNDSRANGKLRGEVESKVVEKSGSNSNDSKVSSVASGKQVSGTQEKNVSLDDVYRQNEKIINLLEQIAKNGNKKKVDNSTKPKNEDEEFDGGLDGVL